MSEQLPPSDSETQPEMSKALKREGRSRLLSWIPTGESVDPTTRPVVSSEEVFALLTYATHQGKERNKVKALSQEAHKAVPDPSAVASLYAHLVSDTLPVTGRTLLDSQERGLQRLIGISTVTIIFFVLAFGNAIVDNWVADLVLAEEEGILLKVKRYAWDYLAPFFWGALGACVFLLKKVQDAAKANEYEQHQMQGWGTQVLLGGVLAAIVLIIFDPSSLSTGPLPLRPAAIAFLVGLGVKAVYGGLEKLVDELSKKIAGKEESNA